MSEQTATQDQGEHEVTIKIRAFPYYTEVEDLVSGRPVRQENIAVRGDKVILNDRDYARAKKFDAIEGEDNSADEESPIASGSISVDEATPEDLAKWLKQSPKPTVDEVVEEANNDPERAAKLLEAENLATGQQPRSTLVERLEEIIG